MEPMWDVIDGFSAFFESGFLGIAITALIVAYFIYSLWKAGILQKILERL